MDDTIFAFVLMPFDKGFDDVYKVGIKESATSVNVLAERVDEQLYQEGILERVYRQIDSADIIIADMTGKNPNVFYEVGYAHAKNKVCLLLTQDATDIPFDLKHKRHIIYENLSSLREQLRTNLDWARNVVLGQRQSQLNVVCTSSGTDLRTSKYFAHADIEFTVIIKNASTTLTQDIHSVYFCSTKKWRVKQDGRECGYIDDNDATYERQHFITTPVQRLSPQKWAHITFTVTGLIASALKGDEIKKSYKVKGECLIRVVTGNGDFDFEHVVDTELSEVPF